MSETATPIEPPADEAGPDLGQAVSRGLRWSFLSTIVGRLVNPVTGIVLARLLTPDDFGVFATALVALNGLVSMNDLGVTLAVVRWPGDVRAVARTATTLAMATSCILYVLCFAAAPWFAAAMNTPEATGVLRLLAVTVLIDGISSVPVGLLTREFSQSRRVAAEWAGFVVSTSLTVALAVAGFGAWSLAWGRLAGNVVQTLLLYRLAPVRPRPGWQPEHARALLRYGVPLAGASLLVFGMLNVDYVVVGRNLGPTELGLYLLAFNLSSWPSNILSTTVRRVSIAGFGHLQDDRRALVDSFLRGLRLLLLLAIPIVAVLAVLAEPLVQVVYGDQWLPAADALRFLALLGLVRVAVDFCYDLLAGVGRSRSLMWVQGLWLALLVPALTAGARIAGIEGVAIAHVLVAALIVLPTYLYAVGRIGVPAAGVLRIAARPLAAGILAGAAAGLVAAAISGAFAALVAGGAAAGLAYLATAAPPSELRGLLRSRRPAPAT